MLKHSLAILAISTIPAMAADNIVSSHDVRFDQVSFTCGEMNQAGKVVRLKGKGLPSINSYGRGDLLVNINVWTPQHLSAEEKQLLEKLRNSPNIKPNPGKAEKGGWREKMKEFFHA